MEQLNERFGVQCETCKAVGPTKEEIQHRIISDRPDLDTLQEWFWNDGGCEATDGCWTDADGYCPHGHKSWMLIMGLI